MTTRSEILSSQVTVSSLRITGIYLLPAHVTTLCARMVDGSTNIFSLIFIWSFIAVANKQLIIFELNKMCLF